MPGQPSETSIRSQRLEANKANKTTKGPALSPTPGLRKGWPSAVTESSPADQAGPGVPWLALGLVLAGLGTVLLGPLLPWLSTTWQLTDTQAGVLLAVKFTGAFLGGISVPRRLHVGILLGTLLSCLGFGAFAFADGLLTGSVTLFIAGFGLGEIIASTNILAGCRFEHHTGSALALLNFFWSLGAVATGVLVAALLPRFGIRNPLLGFGALFLFVGLGGAAGLRLRASGAESATSPTPGERLPRPVLLHFGLLLFLYGGLETVMTAWLTTYTLRFSDAQLLGGQSAVVLLWTALTVGRVLAAALMRRFTEQQVRAGSLVPALLSLLGLLASTHALLQSLCCVGLGLSLAPFFPATFARLMQHRPTARFAGLILAVSGLGAALFPWLVGVVSTQTGSLRLAMGVPVLLILGLLVLGQFEPPRRTGFPSRTSV